MALKINRTVTRITKIVGWGLIIIILACFTKVYIWEKKYYKQESVAPRSDSVAVITKLPVLKNIATSEVTKEDHDNYQVEMAYPRYLKIERLSLDVIVRREAVSNDGALQYPENLNEAAWYSGSSKPGYGGAIVMSGITSYKGSDGAFKGLDSLEQGDKLEIVTGDNKTFGYVVKSISQSSNKDAENVLPKAEQRIDGKETLSLIGVSDGEDSFVVIRATIED